MNKRFLAKYIFVFITGLAVCAVAGGLIYKVIPILALAAILKACRETKPDRFFMTVAVFTAGMLMFSAAAAETAREADLFGDKYITLYGKVTDSPRRNNDTSVMTVRQEAIKRSGKYYKASGYVLVYAPEEITFRAGDRISVIGKYKVPAEASGKGGFNYRTYLKTDDIRATMFVKESNIKFLEHKPDFETAMFDIRRRMGENISKHITGPAGELVKAVTLGDKNNFTDEMKNNFADCGISHIVAISGMHMSILIAFVMLLCRFFGLNRRLRAGISISVIIIYTVILGFIPSALRAAVMGLAVMFATLTNRKEDFITSMALGAFVILLTNPYSLFDAGFILSFSAVIGIKLFAEIFGIYLEKIFPKFIAGILSVSAAVTLTTLPITAMMFNTVNFTGFIANLVVIPFLEILFAGGMITALIPFAGYITGFFLKFVADFILAASDLIARLRFLNISVMTPDIFMLLTFVAVILSIYNLTRKSFAKTVGSIVAVIIFISLTFTANIYEQGKFRIEFINVGQGDSILISSGGENFLIDTGRENSREALEYLKDRGITTLDILFITHSDSDHSGGATNISENIRIKKAVFPKLKVYDPVVATVSESMRKRGTDIIYAGAGDSFKLGDGECILLMPDTGEISDDYTNNNSLVAKITCRGKTALMMGDAGIIAEEILLDKYNLKADILKVGHHGSKNSTSDEFLAEVQPQYSLLSCGKNHYGHPADEVVEKLENIGSIIYRTDEEGNIIFKIDRKGRITVGE